VGAISAEDFVQMLVLDGCLIIELLVNFATGNEEASLHATPFGPTQLSVDLSLAENQIPSFVRVDLINNTRLPEFDTTRYQPTVLLVKLVLYYLAGEKGLDMNDSEYRTSCCMKLQRPSSPCRAVQQQQAYGHAQVDAAYRLFSPHPPMATACF
jgi:hypothetical protein